MTNSMRWLAESLIGEDEYFTTQEFLSLIISNQERYGPRRPRTQESLIALKEVLDED